MIQAEIEAPVTFTLRSTLIRSPFHSKSLVNWEVIGASLPTQATIKPGPLPPFIRDDHSRRSTLSADRIFNPPKFPESEADHPVIPAVSAQAAALEAAASGAVAFAAVDGSTE